MFIESRCVHHSAVFYFLLIMEIRQPTLILDEARCKQNIKFMSDKAKTHGLELRPHFKTHQSHAIGTWFKAEGVSSITVSSVKMAKYFAADGWKEITIAFPVNIRQIDEINELAASAQIHLLISSVETPMLLNKLLKRQVGVYIEVDCGSNRSGFKFNNKIEIQTAKGAINRAEKLKFKGYYSHAGHTYGAKSKEEVESIAKNSLYNFISVRNDGEEAEFCWGDTPSCTVLDSFEGVDALSPGNFVFYDVMQANIGSCDYGQVAVAVGCPVVAKKKAELEIIVQGGAVHLSKDNIEVEGEKVFGIPVTEGTWLPLSNAYVRALSQEHGIIKLSKEDFEKYHIGDLIYILPVHSCLNADAMGGYISKTGEVLDHMSKKSRD